MKRFLALFFALFFSVVADQKRFVFVITSYNNTAYCKENLDSVLKQNYDNYRVIIIDDCSKDGMSELLRNTIEQRHVQNKCCLLRNQKNKGKLANFYFAITQLCDDDEIVIELDGDDVLAHEHVLSKLNEVYQNPYIWLTYGNYVESSGRKGLCQETPKEVIKNHAYRDNRWNYGHIRTFYTWLFKKIKYEDLLYQGNFFSCGADAAYFLPMLEMAAGRFAFIQDILLIYNVQNPLHVSKTKRTAQLHSYNVVKYRKRYMPLAFISNDT